MNRLLLFIVLAIVLGITGWQVTRPPENPTFDAEIIAPDAEIPAFGFAAVEPDYDWSFPGDHQPHPDYQRERWQLDVTACYPAAIEATVTFERLSLVATAFAPERQSAWAVNSVILAALDLPDQQANRYARANVGLAGASEGVVFLETWTLTWVEADQYTLALDGQLVGNFSVTGEPQTAIETTYYQIEQALTGTWQDQPCEATLTHTFGAQLP